MSLPNDLLFMQLFKTTNLHDLSNLCRINKDLMNLCKNNKESISKHIIINIIKIKKPNTFMYYKDFLKHYNTTKKRLYDGYDLRSWYNNFDLIIKRKIKNDPDFYNKFESKFGKIGL